MNFFSDISHLYLFCFFFEWFNSKNIYNKEMNEIYDLLFTTQERISNRKCYLFN
jgi:hypothetical protein